jgi:hypothetical protein
MAERFIGGTLMSLIELSLFNKSENSSPNPPIFFLAAPRSGTTLAMQVITDVFDVGYISNLHCKYYGAPALAEMIFHPIDERPKSDYRSVHGRTNSPHEPSECGEWWYRFFRRSPRYVDLAGANGRKMARFRKSVFSLVHAFGRPVLFKNPHAALRIQPIVKYLPESLFIIIERDVLDNAHSLLEVRNRVHKDYHQWWSMEPPSIERLQKLPAHEQVVEQIRHIYATIKRDLSFSNVDPSACFLLKYEDLCDDPEKEMNRLEGFFRTNGCQVARRYEPPEPFPRRNELRIDRDLLEKVKRYVGES